MSDLKSTTEKNLIYNKFCKKNPLKACVCCFSLFSPNDRILWKKYAKDLCQKLAPNPLLIFLRDC